MQWKILQILRTLTFFILADLECPEDGSDITIDNIGFESRGFRFPAVGTFGFPA